MSKSTREDTHPVDIAAERALMGCSYGCILLSIGIPILVLMVLSALAWQHFLG